MNQPKGGESYLKLHNESKTIARICNLRLSALNPKKTEGGLTLVLVFVDCLLGLNCPSVWQFEKNIGLNLWQLPPPRASACFPTATFGAGVEDGGASWELGPKAPYNPHSFGTLSTPCIQTAWLENEQSHPIFRRDWPCLPHLAGIIVAQSTSAKPPKRVQI